MQIVKKDASKVVNRFSIVQFLARLDYVPDRVSGREHYYISPLRPGERTASFSVNILKNRWYDFGLSRGGTLIDLAVLLLGWEVKEAIELLTQMVAGADATQWQPVDAGAAAKRNTLALPEGADEKKLLLREGELRNGILRKYLTDRGISLEALQADGRVWKLLREVHYSQQIKGVERKFFALGLLNQSGGCELKAKNFQSHYGTKDVTYIPGRQPGVAVFESMMDFFSALTLRYKKFKGKAAGFQCAVLILHSTNYGYKNLHLVENAGCIWYYGDNDKAGLDLLAHYRETCKNVVVYAENDKYRGYKDLNDFLLKLLPTKELPARGQAPSRRSETAKWWLWVVFKAEKGKKDRQCTFYGYTNDTRGYEQLLALRNRLSDDAKVVRLCERTRGREYTYEQLFCPTGAVRVSQSQQRVAA